MRYVLLVTVAAIALAGCKPSVSLTNATPEEVAKATKDAGGIGMKAGQWETKVEFTEVEMMGLPKVSGEEMKNKPDRIKTHSWCLSEKEAANPSAGLWLGGDADSDKCKVAKFTMSGGHIEQTITCADPNGKPGMTLVTEGNYTSESMTGTMSMDAAGFMKMKGNIESRRTGECKPGSEKK